MSNLVPRSVAGRLMQGLLPSASSSASAQVSPAQVDAAVGKAGVAKSARRFLSNLAFTEDKLVEPRQQSIQHR